MVDGHLAYVEIFEISLTLGVRTLPCRSRQRSSSASSSQSNISTASPISTACVIQWLVVWGGLTTSARTGIHKGTHIHAQTQTWVPAERRKHYRFVLTVIPPRLMTVTSRVYVNACSIPPYRLPHFEEGFHPATASRFCLAKMSPTEDPLERCIMTGVTRDTTPPCRKHCTFAYFLYCCHIVYCDVLLSLRKTTISQQCGGVRFNAFAVLPLRIMHGGDLFSDLFDIETIDYL